MTGSISLARIDRLMADLRPGSSALSRRPRPGCVEGAVGNAATAAAYASAGAEPDPLHGAAYLLRSLARNHCFEDGNKRIAWLAALEVLWVHAGCTIAADQVEAAELVVRVATGELDADGLVDWLAARIVAA